MNIIKPHRLLFMVVAVISMLGVVCERGSFGQEPVTKPGTYTAGDDNPVLAVKDSVMSYFYPVRGKIVGIKKGLVKVKFSTDKILKKGMRFSVFRKGKPFHHPVTKELIGSSEEFTGKIEVSESQLKPARTGTGLYLCRVVSGSPKVGDVVRITSSRIKLAFFQNREAEWALSEVFYDSLKNSGRFEILESYTTSYEPDRLTEVAKGLGAEAVLMFSTPIDGNRMFIDVKLFWVQDAELFAEIRETLDTGLVRQFTSRDEVISTGFPITEPWGKYELVNGELIAMGDVDGNGLRELVVSDGNNIKIYRLDEEPQEIWFIKGSNRGEHLSIDILDLNKNGKAEIFVTSLIDDAYDTDIADGEIQRKTYESKISSFVLEYDSAEGYKKIWDKAPYVFRVSGNALLMQSFTPFKKITGPVFEGMWKDGSYQVGRPVEMPAGVNIYGFSFVDWQNSGHSHVLAFDDDGYLSLYNGGELLWKSAESYGRFVQLFKRKTYSLVNDREEWSVRGQLIPVRTERGQEVIVVKKTPLLKRVPGLGYKKAEVYSLWWDGEVMDETLILEGIKGTVTDYLVERDKLLLIARPDLFMFLKKSLSGNFMKGSILYYYNLAGK